MTKLKYARRTDQTDRDREREIVNLLSWMSRDGWRYARPAEYLPLHRELKKLQAARMLARADARRGL